ncbi:MAG: cadherin-like domain-containing protein, partial [Prolixibacteraceae bacterium]|nr:cadherin-like domain-containing protein [Prolixibacteraceae bacterium]
ITLVNVAGGDSVATLNLTVLPVTSSVTDTTILENQLPFVWNGSNYDQGGTYYTSLINVAGCDSLLTLNLTVIASTSSVTDSIVCENLLPLFWNGNLYDTEGTYLDTLISAVGGDSIAILNLVVLKVTSSITNAAVFENDLPFVWNGTDYNEEGTYNTTLVNVEGCDSLLILNLKVIPSTRSVMDTIICAVDLPFEWNGNEYQTDGTYSITLVNAAGADSIATLNLYLSPEIIINRIRGLVSCQGGDDGFIDITVSGGIGPYTYFWNNGKTTEDVTGLSAGRYAVSVTDNIGCNSSLTINLSEKDPMVLNSISKHVDCNGNASGSIELIVSGGTYPYSYAWSNGETTKDNSDLTAGIYNVIVTDVNGCENSLSVEIIQPEELNLSETHVDVGFSKYAIGSIDLTVSGGTKPFIYEWSNGKTTQDIDSLFGGVYTVLVTDSNNCVATLEIIIDAKIPETLINCPTEGPFECVGDLPSAYQTYKEFTENGGTAFSECGLNTVTFQLQNEFSAGNCPQTITRIYEIEDSCENIILCTQIIVIDDQVPPVFIKVPENITIECLPFSIIESYLDFINLGGEVIDNCGVDTNSFQLVIETISSVEICPRTHAYTYAIEDYCGNKAEFTLELIVVDSIRPELNCPPDILLEDTDFSPQPFSNFTDFVNSGGGASDNCEVDPESFMFVSIDSVLHFCGSTYIYVYQISDFCGNTTTCTHRAVKGDVIAPEIKCPTDITVACTDDIPDILNTFEAFIEAGGIAFDNQALDEESFKFISEISDSQTCPNNIIRTYQISDKCENVAECSHLITIHDTIPPEIICPPNVYLECLSAAPTPHTDVQSFIMAGGIISDNCAIDSSSFEFYEEKIETANRIEVVWVYRIKDLCGNEDSCSHFLILTDTIPPEANCNDITIYLDNFGNRILTEDDVRKISENSTDNCTNPEDLIIDFGYYEFDCEDIESRISIDVIVTDEAGNFSVCTAYITITDSIPPVALCQDITIYLNENGQAKIDVDQINNGSYDNCGIDSMYLSKDQFDCNDTGDNIINLTVLDLESNSAVCTANVFVIDSIPPIPLCRDITVQLGDLNNYTLTTEELDNGSYDECGIDNLNLDRYVLDCNSIGKVLIELTATDVNNNISHCISEVTVLGNTPPIAINDTFTTAQDHSIEMTVGDNDYDEITTIDLSTVSVITDPMNGSFEIDRVTGIINYIPNTDFVGLDSLVYSICDDGIPCEPMCDTAKVYITILVANIPPVAVNDTFSMMCYMLTDRLLDNDYDPDSNEFFIDTIPIFSTSHGELILSADGSFMYLPEYEFYGTDSFVYKICDTGIPPYCDEAKVLITVLPDHDCDGTSDIDDIDDDNDGILDVIEGDRKIDSDGDGIPDSLDIDSDNDGIPDNIEGQSETNYIFPTGIDSDFDGWDDAYDPDNGGFHFKPVDTDEDQTPDYLDIDSDGDNVFDFIEGHDIDADGMPDVSRVFMDSDDDGLDDAYDTYDNGNNTSSPNNETGSNAPLQDFDGDGLRDWRDVNDEDDEYNTIKEDWNNDGDYSNDDIDLDGYPDYLDVELSCELLIPEGFSPNNDGVHDFFQVFCIDRYPNAVMRIFNRNGNKLFEKEHYGNLEIWGSNEAAWWWGTSENNLTIGGGTLPAGNYVYVLQLGNGEERTGTVMISY